MILQTYHHISNIKASVGSKTGTENCKEVSEEYKTTATSLEVSENNHDKKKRKETIDATTQTEEEEKHHKCNIM